MLRTRIPIGAVALAVLLGGSACSSTATNSDSISIVAASYPFEFVVERIVGDEAVITTLVPPGVEAHDYELTPKQVFAINGADLVLFQSGMTSAIDAAVEASKSAGVLDTATVVTLLPFHEGDDEHDHDEEADQEHNHGAYDPHIWLDPANLQLVAEAVLERLIELDPANTQLFTKNAHALQTDLSKLDEEFRIGLATCERAEFVTSHAAFGYLANAYDLRQIPIAGVTPESSPSPARLAEIQALAKEYGITTVFTESLASPALAETLARDLGISTDVLDPIEGLSAQSRGSDYFEIMRSNLDALRAANECQN